MEKAIAVQTLCNYDGIAIFTVNDEKITSCFWNGDKYEKPRTTKIYYDFDGNAYFKRYKVRYYLHDFIKV